ncbi:PepSY-associated TM helix domain-containing protein [Roseateles sp. BYS180W]|uniref:PepSY-associated TM helix domain-containing protein n=1 Tax=Roseateles rivi TaxID=3299028 RepID=A0ABW7FYS1_9BURK
MSPNFRQSMAWVHTWFGLVVGFVLIVVFFFGTLSVFDREIDRWSLPNTRFEPQPMPSFDKVLLPASRLATPTDEAMAEGQALSKTPLPSRQDLVADEIWAYTTHRDPLLRMGVDFAVPNPIDPHAHNHIGSDLTIDPRSGQPISSSQLALGTGFIFPMHYSLHLHWAHLGIWLVGLCGLVLMAGLVSGVVIHRKIFREFFTFRPNKHLQRSTLDLHNLTGVVALPFHFFFGLTGLMIFAAIYLPITDTQLKPLHERHEAAAHAAKGLPEHRAGVAAPLASVDAMVQDAKARWAARGMPGEVGFLQIHHLGDANSYVSLHRAGSDRVALVGQTIHYAGATGRLLHEEPERSKAAGLHEFFVGLHLQHFEHWALRWLYVLGGLLGCACIATGFVFFVEKRKAQHARQGRSGARWVDALAVTSVTGMVLATLVLLCSNWVLPTQLSERAQWQERLFWGAWLLSFVHAAWRSAPVALARRNPAWAEQCWAVAALALLAVLLNAWATGDALWRTLPQAYWPVAAMDICLLLTAGVSAWAARRLGRARQGQSATVTPLRQEGAHA